MVEQAFWPAAESNRCFPRPRMQPKNDLRVQRTRRLIREAFEKMICEMDYEQISIKKLTERAGISRKTFYLHYQDLDDLLQEFQAAMVDAFLERTAGMRRPEDMAEITREFFLHSEKLGKLAQTLICNGNYSYIGSRITAKIMEQTWGRDGSHSGNTPEYMDFVSTFVAQSTLAIYRRWVADGKRIPLDDIIKLTTRLICSGLDGVSTHQDPPLNR